MYSVAPERIWKWEDTGQFFVSKSTISRFGERFRDGQYSLVSFLFAFFYSRCPPAICKSGGACPHALWSRRHWMYWKVICRLISAESHLKLPLLCTVYLSLASQIKQLGFSLPMPHHDLNCSLKVMRICLFLSVYSPYSAVQRTEQL